MIRPIVLLRQFLIVALRIAYAEYWYNVPIPILLSYEIALLLVVHYG